MYFSIIFYSIQEKVTDSLMSFKSPSLSEKDQNHLAKTFLKIKSIIVFLRYIAQLSEEKCGTEFLFFDFPVLLFQGTRNSTS